MTREILQSQNIADCHLEIEFSYYILIYRPKNDENNVGRYQTLYATLHKTNDVRIGGQ